MVLTEPIPFRHSPLRRRGPSAASPQASAAEVQLVYLQTTDISHEELLLRYRIVWRAGSSWTYVADEVRLLRAGMLGDSLGPGFPPGQVSGFCSVSAACAAFGGVSTRDKMIHNI